MIREHETKTWSKRVQLQTKLMWNLDWWLMNVDSLYLHFSHHFFRCFSHPSFHHEFLHLSLARPKRPGMLLHKRGTASVAWPWVFFFWGGGYVCFVLGGSCLNGGFSNFAGVFHCEAKLVDSFSVDLRLGKPSCKCWDMSPSDGGLADWEVFLFLATYGCFRKWWYPQNTSKWSFLVGKPMVVGYHHFRKHPYHFQVRKSAKKKKTTKETLRSNWNTPMMLHELIIPGPSKTCFKWFCYRVSGFTILKGKNWHPLEGAGM